MAQYINKDALVAEIENLENTYKKCPTRNSYEDGLKDGRLIGYKDALYKISTLEVKKVDLEKEKIENIEKQCPFREVVCSKYQDHLLKCSGACAFVSDRITLEKKHLHDIQNVPVDEERLKMDRRNTV